MRIKIEAKKRDCIHWSGRHFRRLRGFRLQPIGYVLVVGVAVLSATQFTTAADQQFPSIAQVQQIVAKQFATLNDYQPVDLISSDQVAPIFEQLARAGWKVGDREQILKLVPANDEFLVRELRTLAGRKFMRQSCNYPEAYDRLDRLSRMPMGHQNVDALIAGPDGYKMIQYMTSTPGGRNLGQMLSQDPRGANFNSTTGRIYTAGQLLERLTESYQSALNRRAQNNGT